MIKKFVYIRGVLWRPNGILICSICWYSLLNEEWIKWWSREP